MPPQIFIRQTTIPMNGVFKLMKNSLYIRSQIILRGKHPINYSLGMIKDLVLIAVFKIFFLRCSFLRQYRSQMAAPIRERGKPFQFHFKCMVSSQADLNWHRSMKLHCFIPSEGLVYNVFLQLSFDQSCNLSRYKQWDQNILTAYGN